MVGQEVGGRFLLIVILFLAIWRSSGEFLRHNGSASHSHASHNKSSSHRLYAGMKLFALENALRERTARQKLVAAIETLKAGQRPGSDGETDFHDVVPSIILESHRVSESEDKFIVAPRAISRLGKTFVVYVAGIASDPSFEEYMASLGAEVHGFDCTGAGRADWRYHYHPWCIGKEKDFLSSTASPPDKLKERKLEYHRLGEIRQLLNHTHVDMFKFDIEGCEWDLIYDEIIHGNEADLPTQLLFELHTQGANPRWVPRDIVQGKGRQEVDQLILDLFHLGYRVFHLHVNGTDHHRAGVSLYRV